MKRLFYIILFVFLTAGMVYARGYDMNLPLPGNSIANDKLQFEVVNDIYERSIKKYPACTDYKIINTQIVHYPYDVKKKKGKYISGYWKEMWSVKACDRVFQVPLTFYLNKKKTTYVIDM